MALTQVSAGNTFFANDVNQCQAPLQRPSGGSDTGSYIVKFGSYVSGAVLTDYVQAWNRNSTPVSVSVDTSIISPANIGSPNTAFLTFAGFQVWAVTNAVNVNASVGGNWTTQY